MLLGQASDHLHFPSLRHTAVCRPVSFRSLRFSDSVVRNAGTKTCDWISPLAKVALQLWQEWTCCTFYNHRRCHFRMLAIAFATCAQNRFCGLCLQVLRQPTAQPDCARCLSTLTLADRGHEPRNAPCGIPPGGRRKVGGNHQRGPRSSQSTDERHRAPGGGRNIHADPLPPPNPGRWWSWTVVATPTEKRSAS